MLAIMLVAINKGFWQADQQTIAQLAEQFAELVAVNGLPGSGHPDPEHPMLPWLQQSFSEQQWQAIAQRITAALGSPEPLAAEEKEIHRIAEIMLQAEPENTASDDGLLPGDQPQTLQQQSGVSANGGAG